jgi:hypothetical protein
VLYQSVRDKIESNTIIGSGATGRVYTATIGGVDYAVKKIVAYIDNIS